MSGVIIEENRGPRSVDENQGELPAVLTVAEVAELLRVNRNTVYDLFQRREIPGGRKVGRCIRFSRDAVVMWLKGNHRDSHSSGSLE